MKGLPVVPRQQATRDTQAALDHYLATAGADVALRFLEALEQAYAHIGRHPGSGSPRYAHELNLPGLRSWSLAPFPYLVFYCPGRTQVDVWRLLHQERDIPATLQIPDAP